MTEPKKRKSFSKNVIISVVEFTLSLTIIAGRVAFELSERPFLSVKRLHTIIYYFRFSFENSYGFIKIIDRDILV